MTPSVAGAPSGVQDSAEYVHPPVGKWMIAVGMLLFGDDNPFGWRFAAALTGIILSIGLVMLAGWLLFRSITVATLAGLLLSIDGLHLYSRVFALLDIFLMFLAACRLLASVGRLDRYQGRRALARRIAAHAASSNGGAPTDLSCVLASALGLRYWRLVAGVCSGLAVGVKWNALFIAIFGLLTVFWDANARRIWRCEALVRVRFPRGRRAGVLCSCIGTGLLTYLASWSGWFLSSTAYYRNQGGRAPG